VLGGGADLFGGFVHEPRADQVLQEPRLRERGEIRQSGMLLRGFLEALLEILGALPDDVDAGAPLERGEHVDEALRLDPADRPGNGDLLVLEAVAVRGVGTAVGPGADNRPRRSAGGHRGDRQKPADQGCETSHAATSRHSS
jgi:hypothetical protein